MSSLRILSPCSNLPRRTLPPDSRILILKPDRLTAELMVRMVGLVLSTATVLVAFSLAQAFSVLSAGPVDLLVTDIYATDGDVLENLPDWTRGVKRVRRTMVVTDRREPAVLHALRELHVAGILDQTAEGIAAFDSAFRAVVTGGHYVSRTIAHELEAEGHSMQSPCAQLSPTERLVLAVIGDGADDATAARMLGMTENSVNSVRRSIHRALHVQHRGELVQRAIQLGFVVHTPHGVIRPGFAQLMAVRRERAARLTAKRPTPPAIATAA